MAKSLKEKIEDFTSDWSWDEKSKVKAFEMGKVLFAFMNFLEQKFSKRTYNNHCDNVFFVGMFTMQYGSEEPFEIEELTGADFHSFQYERKVSDSEYAVNSYEATCRKLDKFIESDDYKPYLEAIENELKKD